MGCCGSNDNHTLKAEVEADKTPEELRKAKKSFVDNRGEIHMAMDEKQLALLEAEPHKWTDPGIVVCVVRCTYAVECVSAFLWPFLSLSFTPIYKLHHTTHFTHT
jgi:hypothetical protein